MTSPSLGARMTAMDASFLYMERPGQALHIGSTCILDGPLSRAELVDHMRRRIDRIPRYRQRAVFDPVNLLHPAWEEDPAFDVERHIFEATLPRQATDRQLKDQIATIFAPMLPRDRPLWQMTVIQGLPGGRSAVTNLVHHCMVDGVSGIELLTAIADLAPDLPSDPETTYVPPPAPDFAERSTRAWRDMMNAGFDLSRQATAWALDPQQQARDFQTVNRALASAAPQMTRPAPATPFNRPVTAARSYQSVGVSFSEIRDVRAAVGGTINDVVLTTLAGGLGAYLRAQGSPTEGVELRAMVPVNVRAEADKSALGNQVSMLIASLPVGIEDPVARHHAVIAGMTRLKEANQAGGFALLTRLSDMIPPAVQAIAAAMAPNSQQLLNLVCTNVPGPQIPLYICGRQMTEHWPLVPLSAGLGLNVCLTSYNGALYWGIVADPTLVPDVEAVGAAIRASFDQLREAALATVAAG